VSSKICHLEAGPGSGRMRDEIVSRIVCTTHGYNEERRGKARRENHMSSEEYVWNKLEVC
jgi:hypothetical protein